MPKFKWFQILSLLIFWGFVFRVAAQDKPVPAETINIAVLDFDVSGISAQEAKTLTNHFRSHLVNIRYYNVLERGKMEEICREIGFQLSGCSSSECAVEAGKILNVQKMIAGNIGKVGDTYSLQISLIHVESSRIEESILRTYQGKAEGLLDILSEAAMEMSRVRIEHMTILPFYLFGAATAASIGAGGYFYLQRSDAYDRYKAARTTSAMRSAKDDTQNYTNYMIYSGLSAGTALLSLYLYKRYYDEHGTRYVRVAVSGKSRTEWTAAISFNF